MRIGVVSEGPADFAVIRSVLKAALGLDAADVDSIRPELQTDETERGRPNARAFSNWELVKQECVEHESIRNYLDSTLDEARLVVIHIDTAECHLPGFDVVRPDRGLNDYVQRCRAAVAEQITSWFPPAEDAAWRPWVVLAIAVEETDAWLLPLYETARKPLRDSGSIRDPKARLGRSLNKSNLLSERDRARILREQSALRRYEGISAPLRKPSGLQTAMQGNASLTLFVVDLCAAAESREPGISLLSV